MDDPPGDDGVLHTYILSSLLLVQISSAELATIFIIYHRSCTECFMYYRKSVLHLLECMIHVRLCRCRTELRTLSSTIAMEEDRIFHLLALHNILYVQEVGTHFISLVTI